MKLDPNDTRPLLEILLENESKVDARDFVGQFSESEVQLAVRDLRRSRARRAFIRTCSVTGVAAILTLGARAWLPMFMNSSSPMMALGATLWLSCLGVTIYGIIQILRNDPTKE